VRFGVEVTAIEQDCDCVTATLLERATGRFEAVRADYLIAADGAHSPVRVGLGIGMSGDEETSRQLNVLFRADLESVRGPHRSVLFRVDNDAVHCVIGMAGEQRWILLCAEFADPTPERGAALVRAAAGTPISPSRSSRSTAGSSPRS
jgi:putative polyketide hydroxylase